MTSSQEQPARLGDPDLPYYVRFTDLVRANIVRNWPTLLRMIDEEGFPAGALLSRNVRAWRLDAVVAWLASRPTERKVIPPRRTKQLETN